MLRKVLLVCGIVSSLLYVATTTIIGAMAWEGYSWTSQSVSELFAMNAPSRPIAVPLGVGYSALLVAFGFGTWASAGQKRALRVVASLLVGSGLLDLTAPFFSLTHLRGEAMLAADSIHLVATALTVLLILLAMGIGATAFGKPFLIYSIGTILVLLAFGALGSMDAARAAADLPTPWLGVTERINIYSAMLWRAVLAIALLRTAVERKTSSLGEVTGVQRVA